MYRIILYHKKKFRPVIELLGGLEEVILQASIYTDHYAFQPVKIR